MLFFVLLGCVSVIAALIASIAGFGIGSILTPVLAFQTGTKVAVAAIAIPHFVATAIRCWLVRGQIDKKVLVGFGIASAAGGLGGALLHNALNSPELTTVFACVLMFAGLVGALDLTERMRFGKGAAWVAGVISGMLGGIVGNQGGIRSAALLGFNLQKGSFVATATAIGLMVDLARIPVYLLTQNAQMLAHWQYIAIATAGAVVGTICGVTLLKQVPEALFKRIVSALVFLLGAYMLINETRLLSYLWNTLRIPID